MSPDRSRRRPTHAATVMLVLLLLALSGGAGAHPVQYFWKYDPALFRATHAWNDHSDLRQRHKEWHHNHKRPKPGKREPWRRKHLAFHHRTLDHLHQDAHYHDVVRKQTGQASWYDLEGEMGACGEPLHGLYAAHPRWKCGSLVSVRLGDRYVHVTIQDRGPSMEGRIIDLSKEAFERLAPSEEGVIDVEIYQLAP
ncbi:MAG: septal ring lytic transglycosylase RlpA family protein [Actinomycetota bacterium]|nr:septal ring lytic transglycosylase RlpA family protein [Actinomycetota bacterium]